MDNYIVKVVSLWLITNINFGLKMDNSCKKFIDLFDKRNVAN